MVTMEPSVKDILVHHTASNSEILIHRGRGMSGIDTLKVKGGGFLSQTIGGSRGPRDPDTHF